MLTKKRPTKKRKIDACLGFPGTTKADPVELSDCSQQQQDSQKLPEVKPNGSKLDKGEVSETESSTDSSNSYEDQAAIQREEDFMREFRGEAQAWLLDHGKAFFHVEALAFLRDQNRKKPIGKENTQFGFGNRR